MHSSPEMSKLMPINSYNSVNVNMVDCPVVILVNFLRLRIALLSRQSRPRRSDSRQTIVSCDNSSTQLTPLDEVCSSPFVLEVKEKLIYWDNLNDQEKFIHLFNEQPRTLARFVKDIFLCRKSTIYKWIYVVIFHVFIWTVLRKDFQPVCIVSMGHRWLECYLYWA